MKRWTTSSSNVHRRVRCEGSHAAEDGLPDIQSEWSAEGTRLHHFFGLEETAFHASAEQADDSEMGLVRFARSLANEALERTCAAFAVEPGMEMLTGSEKELWLHKGIKPILPGHCDVWYYWPELKLLFIADAKFGYVEVDPAPLNVQLRTYAVQAAEEFDVENCVVAIVQPRAKASEGEEKLSIARYDRQDIAIARRQLLEWHARWTAPGAPRRPSESACRYCKAQLLCDEYRARLADASTLPDPVLPSLAEMAEDEFVRLWLAISLARNDETWSAMQDEARKRVSEGRMDGFRLKSNADRRYITDRVKAFEMATESLLTAAEYAEASKPSIGDITKLVKKKRKLKGKSGDQLVSALIDDTIGAVIGKAHTSPSVVQIDPDDQQQKTV